MQQRRGSWAEQVARRYLEKRGYKIAFQNYFSRWGEIDLIARRHGQLVFIEVKQRKNHRHGSGLETITPRKIQCLRRAIEYYFIREKSATADMFFRFDVIAISGTQKGPRVTLRHYQDLALE